MRNGLIIVSLLGLLAAPAAARADHSLVLIANAESSTEILSPLDVRKLYLGFAVTNGDREIIRPITNSSSARLWEIFLQDVMGMSARSYDRRLLTLTLQSGRRRPEVLDNLDQILDSVERDRLAVAFVWEENIKDRENIKVLRVLWQQ